MGAVCCEAQVPGPLRNASFPATLWQTWAAAAWLGVAAAGLPVWDRREPGTWIWGSVIGEGLLRVTACRSANLVLLRNTS